MSRLKFEPWPWGLGVLFLSFVLFLLIALVKLSNTHISMVQQDYYDPGPARVALLEAQKRGALDSTHYGYTWNASRSVLALSFSVPFPDSGRINLYRPSDDRLDRHYPLSLSGDGKMKLELNDLESGWWQVQLSWWRNGEWYYHEFSLNIP